MWRLLTGRGFSTLGSGSPDAYRSSGGQDDAVDTFAISYGGQRLEYLLDGEPRRE